MKYARPLLATVYVSLLLISGGAAADYAGPGNSVSAVDLYGDIADRIFQVGKWDGVHRYMEFLDGGLRQYAVARHSPFGDLTDLTFIEEQWTTAGTNVVIDQWIVNVVPGERPRHTKLVEENSIVLEFQQLSTEGSEGVARRIAEKASR